jgi:hypothetical protein
VTHEQRTQQSFFDSPLFDPRRRRESNRRSGRPSSLHLQDATESQRRSGGGPQPRGPAHRARAEHGEHGEDRTLTFASTVASPAA